MRTLLSSGHIGSALAAVLWTFVFTATSLTTSLTSLPAFAEIPAIASRQRHEKKTFTDAEIVAGFMKTTFGAEYHLAGRVDRIRKYQSPVRIFIEGPRADRKIQLGTIVADIAKKIQHLDIALVQKRDDANIVVTLVRNRDFPKTMDAIFGAGKARRIRKSLDPQCLSGFNKNDNYEIEHSRIILTVDNGNFVFLDCAYEEMLQSLGPINDTDSVPWTMFNDNVSMGFFDIYDQHLLNILYDPRIKAGMTAQDVRDLLPAILPDVRAWVAKSNNLPAP